ncbi:MAG: NAD-dependent epimerase/dehydratase family protein [Pseudomonadota bacterium]
MALKVFILGGTGLIGSGVIRELVGHGHVVTALSRSPASDDRLRALGACPVRGDMREPDGWRGHLNSEDAVVHVAATFGDDMGAVDAAVIDALERVAPGRTEPLKVVYTGGCWLYGATGDEIADEGRPFAPIPAFAWMVEHARRLMANRELRTAVVHPAIVYAKGLGGFEHFIAAARKGEPIPVWGAPATRWPLVHQEDLAVAYRLALETRVRGHYNASAEIGVPVERIVAEIARRTGSSAGFTVRSAGDVIAEHGSWALGPMLDQQMTSAKLREAVDWNPTYADFAETELI